MSLPRLLPGRFGHWHTQTFIAGLVHHGLIALWVLDGAMKRASFDAYIEHELASALKPGQRRVQAGCSSHRANEWPDKASGCV